MLKNIELSTVRAVFHIIHSPYCYYEILLIVLLLFKRM